MRVETGCKNLDELLKGGFPYGGYSLIFGEPRIGKTLLLLQIAVKFSIEQKKPVYFLETEGFFTDKDTWDKYINFLNERFGGKADIRLHYIADAYEFTKLFGQEIQLFQKKKKIEVLSFAEFRYFESPLFKALKEGNYGMLIIDSFSDPIEAILSSHIKEFPERKNLIKPPLDVIKNIGARLGIPIILTVHETKDPTNQYDKGNPILGWVIRYAIKTVIQIRRSRGKENRKVELYRAPGIMESKAEPIYLTIKEDIGFVDAKKEEEKEVKK